MRHARTSVRSALNRARTAPTSEVSSARRPNNASYGFVAWPVKFPLLWTAFFLYACLDRKLARAYLLMGALFAVNAALIAWHLTK